MQPDINVYECPVMKFRLMVASSITLRIQKLQTGIKDNPKNKTRTILDLACNSKNSPDFLLPFQTNKQTKKQTSLSVN